MMKLKANRYLLSIIFLIILFLFFYFFIKIDNQKHTIFLGIDSLTEGAGGTTYRDFFKKDTVSHKIGYLSLDYKTTKEASISVFMTDNMNWFSSEQSYSSYPKKFSLDGKGVYTNSGNQDRCVFNIQKFKNYKKIGIYYLKQPRGGSFVLSVNHKDIFLNRRKVNTNSDKYEIGYSEISIDSLNRFNIDSIFGKVTLFGLNFNNSDIKRTY